MTPFSIHRTSFFLLLLAGGAALGAEQLRSSGEFLVKVAPMPIPPRAAARAGGASQAAGWKWHALGADRRAPAAGARAAVAGRAAGGSSWIVASPAAMPPAAPVGRRAAAAAGREVSRLHVPSTTPWDDAHDNLRLHTLPRGGVSLRAALRSEGLEIRSIEPNIVRECILPEGASAPIESAPQAGHATLGTSLQSWPSREPFDWHLDATGLREARRIIESTPGTARRVRVALLDTGYDPDHITRPRYFLEHLSTRFLPNGLEDGAPRGRSDKSGHGTATMAILAGNRVRIGDGAPVDFGAAPSVEVFQVRIYDQVVLLGVASLSAGLHHAIDSGADVVSISMGGVPSNAWAEAVNRAYENGTVVVAASGNCLAVPILGWVSTPSRTVYPAAFPRVLSVPGATASSRSYRWLPLPGGLWPWNWKTVLMRGNIGPRADMLEAVGAFTPNIAWAVFERPNGQPHGGISRSGAGTSSATPQVAAAAALWLQKHRGEVERRYGWRSYEKVEAVYQALFRSADGTEDRPYPRADDSGAVGQWFGHGMLRTDRALAIGVPASLPASAEKARPKATAGLRWLRLLLPVDPALARTSGARDAEVRTEMLQLEAAQLVAISPKLQRLLGEIDPETGQLPPAVQPRFKAALAAEPAASRALREAVAREQKAAARQ